MVNENRTFEIESTNLAEGNLFLHHKSLENIKNLEMVRSQAHSQKNLPPTANGSGKE